VTPPQLQTGCDLVDIERLGAAIERRPQLRERVFTARELGDACRDGVDIDSPVALARLAARFAAKEAGRKALGDLRLPFHALEVQTADDGAPELWLHGRRSSLQCSLSHDGGIAMAVVVGFAAASDATEPSATGQASSDGPASELPATELPTSELPTSEPATELPTPDTTHAELTRE
jgi:holo-[acyl-carrier protein] synthase